MKTGYQLYQDRLLKSRDSLHAVYVGVNEIDGHLGWTKLGRTSNPYALQRGRNQGGANWWFCALWECSSRAQSWTLERSCHACVSQHRIVGPQRQRELYDVPPHALIEMLQPVLDHLPRII